MTRFDWFSTGLNRINTEHSRLLAEQRAKSELLKSCDFLTSSKNLLKLSGRNVEIDYRNSRKDESLFTATSIGKLEPK